MIKVCFITFIITMFAEVQNELEMKAKTFLQEYTTRMVENKLTVNP